MENVYLVSGAIIALGLFICIFLILRSSRKVSAIKHYEEIRDKLTLREIKVIKEEVEELQDMPFNLQDFIIAIVIVGITVVIGVYICGELGAAMGAGSAAMNVSESLSEELAGGAGFVQTIGIVGVATMLITIILSLFLRKKGLINDEETNKKEKEAVRAIEHYKQTRDDLTIRK